MSFSLITEDVVVSGIAGKLPDSENMEVFEKKLLSGDDMVTSERPRWTPGVLGLPERNGRIMELDKFDAQFFGVNTKQAQSMDPQMRMLLELTHEAMIDAGMNPQELRGSKTGVFIGVSTSDSELFLTTHSDFINGYVSPGHHRSMIANRISFTFDLKGPSFPVDTACSSSMVALESAVNFIRLGKCDSAIVGGSNLILHPYVSFHSHKLGMFSPDGKCKSFDISGDGYVRSEGVVVILLQKKSDARREYLTILNIRSNTDGYKENGLTFPSGQVQKLLLEETYAEVGIDPLSIEYFEAHGTGTKAGDPQELNSVTEVFCNNRTDGNGLMIGSVKSNVGHLEPVAGLASVAKMIVAAQVGIIPANLHYNIPNPEIPALKDGRLKVVTENTKWERGLFGLNSFGWGGANVHVICKPGAKFCQPETKNDLASLIVPFSGRTLDAVNFAFEKLAAMSEKREVIALNHGIHKLNIQGHKYRGYTLVKDNNLQSTRVQEVSVGKYPRIWYIFSGMGSQSSIVGLMSIEPFRKSIEKSASILERLGYDLISKIDNLTFDTVTDSFVNIVITQVAMVDTLKSLGIEPEGIIGHSVGEVSCGYADGCLTQEEAVQLAYWRAMSLTAAESECVVGSMAAVGLSWDDLKSRCPEGILLACHNTNNSVTLSGPVDSIKKFVQELNSQSIFAKEVPTNGFAFHSKYINPATDHLKKMLARAGLPFVTNPKNRSPKWISTSVLDEKADVTKFCSVDYHVNNLISPVYFAEALARIPEEAIVIELAPHALLQALLRRGLNTNCTKIGLTKRDAEDSMDHFLEAIGSIYLMGVPLDFSKLYKDIKFPVSVDTPMIAPLIKWDHNFSWDVGSFTKPYRLSGEGIVDFSLNTDEYGFLADHVIDGRNICPVMMYIYSTWRTFAMLHDSSPEKFPVVFESVEFHRPILLSKESKVRLLIQVMSNGGQFEIEESNSLLSTGRIRKLRDGEIAQFPLAQFNKLNDSEQMAQDDIYKELKLRGYEYKSNFLGLKSQAMHGESARVKWTNHWVSFLDSVLHPLIIPKTSRGLILPASLRKLAIDPIQIMNMFNQNSVVSTQGLPAIVSLQSNSIFCPGLQVEEMGTQRASRNPLTRRLPMLNDCIFLPYINTKEQRPVNVLTALMDIVLDNSDNAVLEFVEFINTSNDNLVKHFNEIDAFRPEYVVKKIVYKETSWEDEEWEKDRLVQGVVVLNTDSITDEITTQLTKSSTYDAVAIHDLKLIQSAQYLVADNGFLIILSQEVIRTSSLEVNNLKLIASQKFNGKTVYLLRKLSKFVDITSYVIIPVHTLTYEWFEKLKSAMTQATQAPTTRILLISQPTDTDSGIVGLVKCLRKEPGGSSVRYIYSQNTIVDLTIPDPECEKILSLDLVHNVVNNVGVHGFYLHRELPLLSTVETMESYLDMETEGDIQSFNWIQTSPHVINHGIVLQIYYATLNLTELSEASYQISQGPCNDSEIKFATEFSGVDVKGRRYVGISDTSTVATTIAMEDGVFLAELPESISLKDAATLPLAYLAAIYSLLYKGNLIEEETILITNGSSPLGQAAIHLANYLNCKIYLSFADFKKLESLEANLQLIKNVNIIEASDSLVKTRINVDVIFNLPGTTDFKKLGVNLKNYGRFIDLASLAELPFSRQSISIHKIQPADLLQRDHPLRKNVAEKFRKLLADGVLKAIPSMVYDKDDVQKALHLISKEDGSKKILLCLRDENKSSFTSCLAIPRTYFDPSKVFILIGGLGETGVEMVSWMVTRGARKFILCNRSGVTNSYQRYHLKNLEKAGATVLCPRTDVTNYEDVQMVFKTANELGPIGGVFNLSMVLRDSFIESMSLADFESVVRPKVLGTINLDKASREFCGTELDYFVVFSSVTSARGNAGQTNYGFGNSMTERLIERRITEGLPGLALQFGPIGDVGHVENNMGGSAEDKIIVGTHPQRIKSVMSALDKLLQDPIGMKASTVMAERNANGSKKTKLTLLESLATILGIPDTKNMDLSYNLGQLGMDSLMTIEIKQMMEQSFGLLITIQQLRTLSISQLLAKEPK